jgi:hypothetical protein
MIEAEWRYNNASIGFYVDGWLEDGQHRLSAAALAGYTLETTVTFGIETNAIITVDDGAGRHASDVAKLDNIKGGKTKQAIVSTAARYLLKTSAPNAKLRKSSLA